MEKADRLERHMKILVLIGRKLFLPPSEDPILPLGEDYSIQMSRLNSKRAEILKSLKKDLSNLTDEQTENGFNQGGQPQSEEAKALVSHYRKRIDDAFGRLSVWYTAPLFRTRSLADFDHWAKSDFLNIDEIVWLSVGLEPEERFINAIKPFNRHGSRQKLDEVTTYLSRHKEIIRRKFDPHDYNHRPDLSELRRWIAEVQLHVHPEFLGILGTCAETEENRPNAAPSVAEILPLDGREMVSMCKLITVMAIDGYGFDPNAKRSPIPNEIQAIADRLGLDLSSNTIRKYLRRGSELLPENWEPERVLFLEELVQIETNKNSNLRQLR